MAQTKKLASEFLTIVVGVLTALGLDAWYGRALDQELGTQYELRIADELRAAQGLLENQERSLDRNIEAGMAASGFFEEVKGSVDHDRLVVSLYNMGRDDQRPFALSTFEDLISTGRLGLISEVDRREAIQNAYGRIQEYEGQRAPYRDEYLTGVRGWIPQRVIDQIRAKCPEMSRAVDWSCSDVDLDPGDVEAIVRRLSTDQALLAFRLREQGLRAARAILERAMVAVDDALALLPVDEREAGST